MKEFVLPLQLPHLLKSQTEHSPLTKEVVQLLPIVQKLPALYETHWIHCVDSSGQAAFIDIAPALLHYNPCSQYSYTQAK